MLRRATGRAAPFGKPQGLPQDDGGLMHARAFDRDAAWTAVAIGNLGQSVRKSSGRRTQLRKGTAASVPPWSGLESSVGAIPTRQLGRSSR